MTDPSPLWLSKHPMGARTVLVVDSSPLSALRAGEALQNSGFRVVVANSQPEAEATLLQEDVAVVLSSLLFPRGNGYDLARQVKSQHPETVVFLLCGSFEVYSQERAKMAGVQGRITRPFTAEAFRRELELVLGPLGEDLPAEAPAPVFAPPPVVAAPAPVAPAADVGSAPVHVPDSEERLATFIPRTYQRTSLPPVDPALIPVVERVVQEVLPEVVEAVLSQALHRSPAFRDLLRLTVEETVRERLPVLARSLVQQRLAELEAQVEAADSPTATAPEGQGTSELAASVAAEGEGTG